MSSTTPSSSVAAGASVPQPQPQPDHFRHKNRLQEYAQRSAMPLPTYHTLNEGLTHHPKFRSTVLIDGDSYTSSATFLHRKEAEQEAAKVALSGILHKVRKEGFPMILEDKTFCKSILNEFAVKMNLEMPTYTTAQTEGKFPTFISTLAFNGKLYPGTPGRNKKEAEQLGALNVIQHILGTEIGPVLSQIINTKRPLFEELRKVKVVNAMPTVPYEKNSVQLENIQEATRTPAFKKPKLEHEASTDLVANVTPPVLDALSSSSRERVTGSQGAATAKKTHRRNKRKGQSEVMANAAGGALPIVQATSVAQ